MSSERKSCPQQIKELQSSSDSSSSSAGYSSTRSDSFIIQPFDDQPQQQFTTIPSQKVGAVIPLTPSQRSSKLTQAKLVPLSSESRPPTPPLREKPTPKRRTKFFGKLKRFRRDPRQVPSKDRLDFEYANFLKNVTEQLEQPKFVKMFVVNPNLASFFMIKYDEVDQFANQVIIPFYLRGTIITGQDILRLAKTMTGTGYQVDRYLTKGGFGSVFFGHIFASESYPDIIGMKVAIKIVINDKGILKYELGISQRLIENPHENILKFYQVFATPNLRRGFFIMEYGDLEDLENSLMWKYDAKTVTWLPFDSQQSKHFIRQIASGVKHLHKLNIAHMDLKPNNVLLFSPNGSGNILSLEQIRAKLTDFGLSIPNRTSQYTGKLMYKIFQRSTILAAAPETRLPEYMKKESDAFKNDVYGVGVMLCQMMMGRDPFTEGEFDGNLQNPVNIKYITRKKMNIEYLEKGLLKHYYLQGDKLLQDLLRKTLEPNWEQRITIDQFLEHPWVRGEISLQETKQLIREGKLDFVKAFELDHLKKSTDIQTRKVYSN